jgi:hypothetical protein
MTFDSYYWRDARAASPELERARERLAADRDRAAFALLLRSGDPVAVGIALDQYHYAEASSRHGTANAFAEHTEEVASRAREILHDPPSGPDRGAEPGANHASALGALMNLAGPEDAALIADVLDRTRTTNLRFAASLAAGTALERSVSPDARLLTALEELALDHAAELDERLAALSALGRSQSVAASNALLRATRVSDVGLQATASLHLLDRDPRAYRDRIAELALAWPEDPPYPAGDVLELLADDTVEP